MIEIKQLRYQYGGKEPVFSGLDLCLRPNHIYGLLGLNGSGKSTLLNLMTGMLLPQEGSVLIDGQKVARRGVETLSRMFYVPDEFMFLKMKLWRFVGLYAPFYERFDRALLVRCLADFGFSGDVELSALSLGEKKKVMISFALACRTPVVLMDEPTNGLDIPSKSIFRKMLMRHMGEDQLFVLSTHQVHDVEQLLDEVIILRPGKLPFTASMEALAGRYRFASGPTDEGALYAEPSPEGFRVVTEQAGGDESQVDLELLFNAVTKGFLR